MGGDLIYKVVSLFKDGMQLEPVQEYRNKVVNYKIDLLGKRKYLVPNCHSTKKLT